MRRVLALGLVVATTGACALFGFDLGGYGPAAGGSGGGGASQATSTQASGGHGGAGTGGATGSGGGGGTGVGAGGASGGCGDGVVNTGKFCFRQPVHFAAGGTPAGLALADLDGSGGAEIIVGLPAAGMLSVLRSQGGRVFAPPVQFQASMGVNHIAVGPILGSKLDVFCGNAATGSVFLNTSTAASVVLTQQLFLGANGMGHPVVVADVNGDTHSNLVIAESSINQLLVYVNNGMGSFQANTSILLGAGEVAALYSADLDDDGKPDLVVVDDLKNYLQILINTGNTFTVSTVAMGQTPVAAVIADLDGDDAQDIATANTDGSIGLFKGNGNGAFTNLGTVPVSTRLSAITVGDFNADGKLDLAVIDAVDAKVHVMKNLGSGFDPGPTLGPFAAPTEIATKDLDGDGALDIVVLDPPTNGVSVVFSNP